MIATSEPAAEGRGGGVTGQERLQSSVGGRESLYVTAVCFALAMFAVLVLIFAVAAHASDGVHVLGRVLA